VKNGGCGVGLYGLGKIGKKKVVKNEQKLTCFEQKYARFEQKLAKIRAF